MTPCIAGYLSRVASRKHPYTIKVLGYTYGQLVLGVKGVRV